MASKQIHLFATRNDLEPGIRAIEADYQLKYVLCGMFCSPDVPSWRSLLELETLGKAPRGDRPQCEYYLVLKADADLEVRSVPQRSGGTMYAVDQLKNPDSIVFQPGGLFSPQFLIAGNIGTVYKDAVSVQLYRDFCRALRRGFTTYNRLYSVGPEAVKLARDGTRLITMHVNEDKEYDLKIEVPRL